MAPIRYTEDEMKVHLRWSIACGSAVATVILAAGAAHSSVVTARLGTGLTDSGNGTTRSTLARRVVHFEVAHRNVMVAPPDLRKGPIVELEVLQDEV
jgi:hypothetical protein